MATAKHRFEGRVALVTGSAKGMGKRLSLDMAKEGTKVVLTDIDEEGLKSTKEEVESSGGSCIAIPCDVSDSAAVDTLVAGGADQCP